MTRARVLHCETPTLAQFSPEELRLWGLAAAGYRNEVVAEQLGGVTVNVIHNAIGRLYEKTGANRRLDKMQPRVILSLMYWRAMGKLRDEEEVCNCSHVHTGEPDIRPVVAYANGHTNGRHG